MRNARPAMPEQHCLTPVRFRYKPGPDEHYLGFIAEGVLKWVATNNRKAVATMDIVLVVTQVVKDQQ